MEWSNKETYFMSHISWDKNETGKIIKSLDSKKSSDIYGLPIDMLLKFISSCLAAS